MEIDGGIGKSGACYLYKAAIRKESVVVLRGEWPVKSYPRSEMHVISCMQEVLFSK